MAIWVGDCGEAVVFEQGFVGEAVADAGREGLVVEVEAHGVVGELLGCDRAAAEAEPWIDEAGCNNEEEPERWRLDQCSAEMFRVFVPPRYCDDHCLSPHQNDGCPSTNSMRELPLIVPTSSDIWMCHHDDDSENP